MPQQLVEATTAIVNARTALSESQRYIDVPKPSMKGLMEHQQRVIDAIAGLGGNMPEEYVSQAVELRAGLREHASTLRRVITRLHEEETEDPPPDDTNKNGENGSDSGKNGDNPVPPQFQKNGGDSDGEDEKTERLLSLLRAEGVDSISVSSLIEELCIRNARLRESARGQVPGAKYQLAIDLGEKCVADNEAAMAKYESTIAKLRGELAESRRESAASKTLLEATVTQYRKERVTATVEALVARNPQLKSIEPKLLRCESVGEIRNLIEGIVKPLSESGSNSRPDLPPTHRGSLQESGRRANGTKPAPRTGKPGGANLMEMLVNGTPSS